MELLPREMRTPTMPMELHLKRVEVLRRSRGNLVLMR
jgi:hypothetical protein